MNLKQSCSLLTTFVFCVCVCPEMNGMSAVETNDTGHPVQQMGRAVKFHAGHVCRADTTITQRFLFTQFDA